MVKHKKTIKRKKTLQKQRGKGSACSRPPSENNSIQMTIHGDTLYQQILQTIATCNNILSSITPINKKDQLNKVKSLVALVMQLKEIAVIKNDSEKYTNIIRELVSLNRIIKPLLTESTV